MGLKADGFKKGLELFGSDVYQSPDMLNEDYDQEVAVVEDANLATHSMCTGTYTNDLHSLEVRICRRISRYLYDPKTKQRNRVTSVTWIFDDGAPVCKQVEQEQRNRYNESKSYLPMEVADMILSGRVQEMFDHEKSMNNILDFDKIKYTRQLFPLLIRYICKFILERMTPEMILKPGDEYVTINLYGVPQTVEFFIEPIKNCPREMWTPLVSKTFTGTCVASVERLCFSKTIGLDRGFSYGPRVPGEAEVTLLAECKRLLEMGQYESFFCVCDDTDIIPLTLLNYHRMIPGGRLLVVLDEGQSERRAVQRIMNVPRTIELINEYFAANLPAVVHPIPFLCLWMALMGTDYVEHIPGLSGTLFFEKFLVRELPEFFRQLPAEDAQMLIRESPAGIEFIENTVIQMIIKYHSNYPEAWQGNPQFKARVQQNPPTTVEQLIAMTVNKSKKKTIPATTDKAYAHVRRAAWQINYWLFGPTGAHNVWNPLEVSQVQATGELVSLFGYTMNGSGEICWAGRVYRGS